MLEDKIIKKLLEHDDKIERLVTKDEFKIFRDEVLNGQDKMIGILTRLDRAGSRGTEK